MNARRERGVALIAAVLVVALATVLVAALLDRGEAARARTRNALRAEQGWQLMLGLEGWAATALRRDAEQSGIDSRDDVWAQPLPPLDLPEARIQGRMREIGGCFNLNSLQQGGVENTTAVERFERLLDALKLDSQRISAQVRDWIDPDATPNSEGAEDMSLMLRSPPYRAANRAFTHVSELRLLPAIDAKTYAVLAPQVCALPSNVPMNLNTVSVEGWMSLSREIGPTQAKILARDGRARYSGPADLEQEFTRLGLQIPLGSDLGFASHYFVLEAEILADGVPFLYSSLLQRSPDGVRVLARSRGRY